MNRTGVSLVDRLLIRIRLRILAWGFGGLFDPPPPLDKRVVRVLAWAEDELSATDIWRAIGRHRLSRPRLASIQTTLTYLESLGAVTSRDHYGGPWRAQAAEPRYRLSDAASLDE